MAPEINETSLQTRPERRRVLLIAQDNWHGSARLPTALRNADFQVGLLFRPGAVASESRDAGHRFELPANGSLRDCKPIAQRTITSFAPDIVVPGDDGSVRLLHALKQDLPVRAPSVLRTALERSLPSVDRLPNRTSIVAVATTVGVACPVNAEVDSARGALDFARRHGWPVYLKRDNTAGGSGVRLCPDEATLLAAFAALTNTARSSWTLVGALRQGRQWLRAKGMGDRLGISVQSAATGNPAFHSAVALEGRWLAGISAEVEEFHPRPTGPSTRVLLHGDSAMDDIARKLIAALGYSGYCGLDFIRGPDGGLTFLEFNARPTPVSHLGSLIGRDLGVALNAALSGNPLPPAGPSPSRRIALFPQDWLRAPFAHDREQYYADIPRNDPALLAALASGLPAGWSDPRASQAEPG